MVVREKRGRALKSAERLSCRSIDESGAKRRPAGPPLAAPLPLLFCSRYFF